jgi:cytochrome c biogenesis protein CcdA
MTIEILTSFFGWMSVLTGGLLVFWGLWIMLAPDFTYKLQSKFFPIERKTYDIVIYSFLGIAKLFFLFFCIAPYLALLIIQS